MESPEPKLPNDEDSFQGEAAYWDLIDQAKKELGLPNEDSPWHCRATAYHHQPFQHEKGAASVFEFESGEKAHIYTFSTAREFEQYFLDREASGAGANVPLRRLVLMEGRDPRMMEVLGRNLGMPPALFLLHGLDTDKMKGHRIPAETGEGEGFGAANYLRLADFWVDQTSSDVGWRRYFRLCIPRPTTEFSIDDMPKLRDMYRERHFVSFWSKEESEEGSWTSVILGDTGDGAPPDAEGKSLMRRKLNIEELSKGGGGGGKPTVFVSAPPDTLYMHLRNTYERLPHGATADPGSAMKHCIPIILSTFHTEFRRTRHRIGRRSQNYLTRLKKFQDGAWQAEEASKIAQLQMAAIRNVNMLAHCLTRLGIICGNNPYVSDDNVQRWRWLREQFQDQSEHVQLLMDFYGLRASVEESIFSNKQAKHVGQLTALATFLVPFSVVAGIFSMSGSFAAGQSLFWIFWVVAVPLSCVIFCIRVFPIKEWLSRRKSPDSWRLLEMQRLFRRVKRQSGYVEA